MTGRHTLPAPEGGGLPVTFAIAFPRGAEIICIQSGPGDRLQICIRELFGGGAGLVPAARPQRTADRSFMAPCLFIEPVGAPALGLRQYARQAKADAT